MRKKTRVIPILKSLLAIFKLLSWVLLIPYTLLTFFSSGKIRNDSKYKSNLKTGITEEEGAICPYCKKNLSKYPKKKTLCPHCSQPIYSRTRPIDNKKVLLTEEEASALAIEWMKVYGTYENYLKKQKHRDNIKSKMTKKNGEVPSEEDINWRLYTENCIKASKKGDWGEYRMNRYYMVEMLLKEEKYSQALPLCLEVCALDINQYNFYLNNTDQKTFNLLHPNGPEHSDVDCSLLVCCLFQEKEITKILEIKQEENINNIKQEFMKVSKKVNSYFRYSIPEEKAWIVLSKSLNLFLSSKGIPQ